MATAEKLGEFETRPGVTYATHDSVALAGDLYLPKGAGPFPALVGVHGGGWVQGVRGQFQHWGNYLAARGVALFAVSYRLAKPGQKTFPQAVQDVLAAIQFVRGNAKDLHIAPERIGVFGHSAGGNIGALAALGGKSFAGGYPQDPHVKESTEVKVFAGVYGVTFIVVAINALIARAAYLVATGKMREKLPAAGLAISLAERPPRRHSARWRRAAPRCGSAGCTWQDGRSATASRS